MTCIYRTEGWDFLIAGGALYNNLDYSFTPQHPDGHLRSVPFARRRQPGAAQAAVDPPRLHALL